MTLRRRIFEICKKLHLSHIGSAVSAVTTIDSIYHVKKENPFILSNGHAGLALYVVLEKHYGLNAEELFLKNGVHPKRSDYIFASTGSLGCGLPLAVGYALAGNLTYVCMSDGELYEGSMWEAFEIISKKNLTNLKMCLIFNGYSAYDETNLDAIVNKLRAFGMGVIIVDNNMQEIIPALELHTEIPVVIIVKASSDFKGYKGLQCHYQTL